MQAINQAIVQDTTTSISMDLTILNNVKNRLSAGPLGCPHFVEKASFLIGNYLMSDGLHDLVEIIIIRIFNIKCSKTL